MGRGRKGNQPPLREEVALEPEDSFAKLFAKKKEINEKDIDGR